MTPFIADLSDLTNKVITVSFYHSVIRKRSMQEKKSSPVGLNLYHSSPDVETRINSWIICRRAQMQLYNLSNLEEILYF